MTRSVLCACGCGTEIAGQDSRGRPRRYARDHAGGSEPRLKPTTDFARRLRHLMRRDPAGPMRQVDVARRARALDISGLNTTEINRLVTGTYDPKLSTLRKLARVFGVQLGELLEPSPRRVVTLPRAWWTGVRLARTSETVDVPTLLLPEWCAASDLVVVDFESDLLIVDLRALIADGSLNLWRHPATGQLRLSRVSLEDCGVRYADGDGYVMADSGLAQGEVVAILRRVEREASGVGTGVGTVMA